MKLFYFISEAFRSLVEGKMVTLVSIVTAAVTLFFLTVFSLAAVNLSRWVDQYRSEASAAAFFDVTLSDSASQALFEKIRTVPGVQSAKFVSRSEAYKTFESLYGKELLTAVEGNPFPASAEIVPAPNAVTADLEKAVAKLPGVESVSVSKEWIETMKKFSGGFRTAAAVLVLIILGSLYFTITNTIKLTVYARMDLLVNMQYIGAGWWYVRIPFILEGIIQGMAGAAAAWAGTAALSALLSRFELWTGGPLLLPVLLGIGALLGFAGSLSAVRKIPSGASQPIRR